MVSWGFKAARVFKKIRRNFRKFQRFLGILRISSDFKVLKIFLEILRDIINFQISNSISKFFKEFVGVFPDLHELIGSPKIKIFFLIHWT